DLPTPKPAQPGSRVRGPSRILAAGRAAESCARRCVRPARTRGLRGDRGIPARDLVIASPSVAPEPSPTIAMKFSNPNADVYVPAGDRPADEALSRVTHLCVSAHQDDIEIMAHSGISDCLDQPGKSF